VRITRGSDGQVRLDAAQRLPGRGAYICPEAACVQRALRPKVLERALKEAVSPAALASLQAELNEYLQTRKLT
jgi:predicted RNA-binding protein YlxR (DUF448 family)